jgi:hypothetical protein
MVMNTLWGDDIDTGKLNALIQRQIAQARNLPGGPAPINQLAKLDVKADASAEEWFKSHANMKDLIGRYVLVVRELVQNYSLFIDQYETIVNAQTSKLTEMENRMNLLEQRHAEEMADLFKIIEAAAEGEENAESR